MRAAVLLLLFSAGCSTPATRTLDRFEEIRTEAEAAWARAVAVGDDHARERWGVVVSRTADGARAARDLAGYDNFRDLNGRTLGR